MPRCQAVIRGGSDNESTEPRSRPVRPVWPYSSATAGDLPGGRLSSTLAERIIGTRCRWGIGGGAMLFRLYVEGKTIH